MLSLTQRCSNAVEMSTVLVSGSKDSCSGAVIFSQLRLTQNCSSERLISQATTWTRQNSRADIRVETSHETGSVCRPADCVKKQVCSTHGYCHRTSQGGYKSEIATVKCGRNRNRIAFPGSGQCSGHKQDLRRHCAELM